MTKIISKKVPHVGHLGSEILVVGEAPGADEADKGVPFVGVSGQLLREVIRRTGHSDTEGIRYANLCNYRPQGNDFKHLLDTVELKEGIRELYEYINAFPPRVIIALGNWPLRFLTGKGGIKNYRGSILPLLSNPSIKVVPSVHPAYVTRDHKWYPILDHDIRRGVGELRIEDFQYPAYDIVHNPTGFALEEEVERLASAPIIAVDIETIKGTQTILCIGFCGERNRAVVTVPDSDQKRRAINRILSNDSDKVFHFGTFDSAVLRANQFDLRNYKHDTIVAAHVLNPELPRTLAFLTSIYTRQIFYKKEGRENIPTDDSKAIGDTKSWSAKYDRAKLYSYNGTDCCVTYEVHMAQQSDINADPILKRFYDFEIGMLPVAERMGSYGMLRDANRTEQLEVALLKSWGHKQWILNQATGYETNVSSPKLLAILYEHFKLPPKTKRNGRLTADEDAIVDLIGHCKGKLGEAKSEKGKEEWIIKLGVCKKILEIRGIRKLLSSYIRAKTGPDGRLRCTFRVDGTETGRWSCKKFVDDTGTNMQTIPREALEVPDDIVNLVAVSADEVSEEEEEELDAAEV